MNKTPSPKHATNKAQPAKPPIAKPHMDVKHGQELLAKVNTRKEELAHGLKAVQTATPKGEEETSYANDIEKALMAVKTLLTGDVAHINEANAAKLNQWLETSALLLTGKGARPHHEPAATVKSAPQAH